MIRSTLRRLDDAIVDWLMRLAWRAVCAVLDRLIPECIVVPEPWEGAYS